MAAVIINGWRFEPHCYVAWKSWAQNYQGALTYIDMTDKSYGQDPIALAYHFIHRARSSQCQHSSKDPKIRHLAICQFQTTPFQA